MVLNATLLTLRLGHGVYLKPTSETACQSACSPVLLLLAPLSCVPVSASCPASSLRLPTHLAHMAPKDAKAAKVLPSSRIHTCVQLQRYCWRAALTAVLCCKLRVKKVGVGNIAAALGEFSARASQPAL